MKITITINKICVVAIIIYFVFLAIIFDFRLNREIVNNNCANLHWNIDSIINLPIDSVYNYTDDNNIHKIFYFTNYEL